MNKILRIVAFVIGLCTAASSFADHEITMGYCPNELTNETSGIANTLSSGTLSFQAAILIPGSRLMALKGHYLTKMRFACTEGVSNIYAWARYDLKSTVINNRPTKVGTAKAGWNEVTFVEPIEITGKDLYIGYNGKVPAGGAIYCDGASNPNGNFFYDGTAWSNFTNYGYEPLCIQVIAEINGDLPLNDLAVEKCTFGAPYTRVGDDLSATITINNYGEKETNIPAMHYSVGDGKVHDISVEGQIFPEEVQALDITINTADMPEGKVPLKIWMDADNEYKDNDTLNTVIYTYNDAYKRKTLIEHFTTLKCSNCPLGHDVLNALVSGRKDYVWVAHHIGYQTDELTQQTSYSLQKFGIQAAPMGMFDRRMLNNNDYADQPAFSLLKGNGSSVVYPHLKLLQGPFEVATSTPAFVSVNIENHYDPATRQLTTTISGERNKIFTTFYNKSCLTVELIEDKVNTKAAQLYSGEKIHNHVYRDAITRITGDSINWTDDTYSETYTYTIPETWNADNVSVVAFVNRPTDDVTNAEVLNAESLNINHVTGIQSATTAGAQVLSRTLFNLQGQRIDRAPLNGAYIERVETTQGVQTIKHVK